MSMYLPNPDVRATGSEAAEFLDIPPMAESDRHPAPARPVRLDVQTRLNITRWAEDYIAGLVLHHHGDTEDVRTVIDDLHAQRFLPDRLDGARRGPLAERPL